MMSDNDDKQGFEIYGKFFPFVSYDEWLNRDFVLARQLTGVTTEELFGDAVMMQQALVAIAVAHESPEQSRDQIVAWVGGLNPAAVVEVGFDVPERPSPLLESEPNGNGGSSSPTSDGSTESTPEPVLTVSSGSRGSGIGSPE